MYGFISCYKTINISARGFIPDRAPKFVSDLLKDYQDHPTSINGNIYSDMVREKALLAVLKMYPEGNAIWQDAHSRIHRCPEALEAVQKSFQSRINHEK